jgi:hypothetical protein
MESVFHVISAMYMCICKMSPKVSKERMYFMGSFDSHMFSE